MEDSYNVEDLDDDNNENLECQRIHLCIEMESKIYIFKKLSF